MNLNLQELVCGEPGRLSLTRRWSSHRVIHQESVAEHSYYVCLYAGILGKYFEKNEGGEKLDWDDLIFRALFHDFEEALTGDMPRSFKYLDDDLRETLDRVANVAMNTLLQTLFDPISVSGFMGYWRQAKDCTTEGRLVAIADFLSALSYCYNEMRVGNLGIQDHLLSMKEYHAYLQTESFVSSDREPVLRKILIKVSKVFDHVFPPKEDQLW
jgi:5'-deoxynucleotidase